MAETRKISLLYSPAEDRLALDIEDVEGAGTRLWLTQRLCRMLVSTLVPMLRKVAMHRLPPDARETAQSWAQAAAMADFGKTPGVRVQPDGISGLVEAVHISPPGEQMTLTFDFGTGRSRVVSLDVPALRQTLAVMYRLHVEAGWSLEIWPSWIADPTVDAATSGVVN